MIEAKHRDRRLSALVLIASVAAFILVQLRQEYSVLLLSQESRCNAYPRITNDSLSLLINSTISKTVLKENSLNFCGRSELPVDEPKRIHQILYQCAGDKYDRFVEKMRKYASDNRTNTWGKRKFPVPANKTVLMIGNSHTRQAGNALWCQYADVVTHSASYQDGANVSLAFENGSILLMVANVPVVYSRAWDQTVGKYLHRNISSIDAIVLGQFNNFDPKHLNSYFIQSMLKYSEANDEVDFEHIKGPDLRGVAKRYSGPIVTVSMFGREEGHFGRTSLSTMEQLKAATNRSNFRFVSGKEHIRAMLPCAAGSGKEVGECGTSPSTHQCNGEKGGHPDLIAWDIVENLHGVLS